MTVSAIAPLVTYAGNGATTVFSVPYKFFSAADLTVTTKDASGNVLTLVLGTGYTVSGAGVDTGGSVTLSSAPASGTSVSVRRHTPRTQPTSLFGLLNFSTKTNETIADRNTMIAQEVAQDLSDVNTSLTAAIGGGGTGTVTDQFLDLASNPGASPSLTTRSKIINSNGVLQRSENAGAFKALWADSTGSASASGGTLTVNISEHTFIELLLDADGTLNVPTVAQGASYTAGTRFTVKVTQDSTGGRQLAFGASFVGASRVAPRQGPGQVSTFDFKRTAAGTWYLHHFSAIDLNRDLNAKTDFGAVNDGTTTNQNIPIQAAIDFAMYRTNGKQGVYVPGGSAAYMLNRGLQLNYGDAVRQINFYGDGPSYGGQGNFNGTIFDCTAFSNEPAISLNALYNSKVRRFALRGANLTWIVNKGLANSVPGGQSAPLLDDTLAASWWDTGLAANGDSRYAPYAGIAQDPYKGTAPTPAYPNRSYPAFSGVSAQYGAALSTNNCIEDVHIRGFNVGICLDPSGADGNGDFFSASNVSIDYCKWGISVGHTQSRNVDLQKIKQANTFCCWTNNKHGLANGRFGGTFSNCSVSSCIKLFDFGSSSIFGPVEFNNLYAEVLWRLGDYTETAANPQGFVFNGGGFNFELQDQFRGVPSRTMGSNGSWTAVEFNRCSFAQFPSVLLFDEIGPKFDDCTFQPTSRNTSVAHPYQAFAHNALCGGLVLARLYGTGVTNCNVQFYNLDSATPDLFVKVNSDFLLANRPHCAPLYARTLLPNQANSRGGGVINPQFRGIGWDKTVSYAIASTSISGIELTINLATGVFGAGFQDAGGMQPGDVWLDDATGTVFFVRSRTGSAVTGVAQNNTITVGGTQQFITTPSTTTGVIYAITSRIYTPSHFYFGDIASTSTFITNVQWTDGTASAVTSDFAAGDRLWVDERTGDEKPLITQDGGLLTAVANSPGKLTVTTAATGTATQKLIKLLTRASPANSAS